MDRLRRRDVEAVADRRVDPERQPDAQPVVDDGRDERPLLRHQHLLLDHRRDDEDVVRASGSSTSRSRGRACPTRATNASSCRSTSCCRGRVLRELVGRREEEALEVRHASSSGSRPGTVDLPVSREVLRGRRAGRDVALVLRDLVHRGDPLGHLGAREALREDDLEHRLRGLEPVVAGASREPRRRRPHRPCRRRAQAIAARTPKPRTSPPTSRERPRAPASAAR